jgi:hypothetical protein
MQSRHRPPVRFALWLDAVSAAEFDRIVDPQKMVKPYVAAN